MPLPEIVYDMDINVPQPTEADNTYAQLRSLRVWNEGGDPNVAYYDALNKGIGPAMSEDLNFDRVEQINALNESLRVQMEQSPEEALEDLAVVDSVIQEIEEETQSPIAAYKMILEALQEQDLELPPELIEEQAEQIFYGTIMQAMYDRDGWGTAGDIMGMIFAPNEAFIARDLVEGQSWWTAIRDTEQFVARFNTLPLEERIQTFMNIADEVQNRTGNEIKAMNFLSYLVDLKGSDRVTFNLMLDQLGLGAVVLDLAFLGSWTAGRVTNTVRAASSVENQRLAKQVLDNLAIDEEMRNIARMDQVDVAAHQSPFQLNDSLFNGMPSAVREEVGVGISRTQEAFASAESRALKEGIDTLINDPSAAVGRMTNEILADEAGLTVTNVRVVSSDARGATFRYDVMDGDRAVNKQVTKYYTVNDITGGFTNEGYLPRLTLGRFISSPNLKFQDDGEALSKTFQRGMFQSGIYRRAFDSEFNRILRLTPRAEARKVGEALETGNLEGAVYSYDILRGKFGLTDAGANQYYQYRHMMDMAWVLKNKEIAQRNITAGNKLFQIGADRHLVKIYDNPQRAESVFRNSDSINVLLFDDVTEAGRPLMLRPSITANISEDLAQYIEDGYVLMRPQGDGGIVRQGEEGYRFILARRESVADIQPSTPLLNYQEGYIPIMYGPDANYFGQVIRTTSVDGRIEPVGKTTRVYFANRSDAEDWARQNNIRYLDQKYGAGQGLARLNDPAEFKPYSFKRDRELARDEFDTMGFGGPFTGSRATERLRKGINEESPEFVNAFESMSKYMGNIASNLPLASFRVGIEDKWMTHARLTGALPSNYTGSFADAVEAVRTNRAIAPSVRDFLVDSHQNISYNTRVPTLGEQQVAGRAVEMAERLERTLGRDAKLIKALNRLDHMNLPDSIRAATFHVLLGFYNPAQLVIQASGSAVAITVDPIRAAKGLPHAFGFTLVDSITNPTARAAAIQRLNNAYPGFAERYNAWNRTGFFDEVIRTSGDYRSLASSHPVGDDMLSRAAAATSNQIDRAAVFYKSGELFNRRLSFATAIERHLAKGGRLDDRGIKQVMNEANDFLLNMDRTMKAEFQKGWISIPTQFTQVHTKFLETILNKRLTGAEKSRMMAMQLALYGGFGIPLGNHMLGYTLDRFGVEPGDLSEAQISAMSEGMVGFILRELFEIDAEIVSRIAIPGGFGNYVERFFVDDPSLWEVLAGAAGVIPQRALDIGGSMTRLLNSTEFDVSQFDQADVTAASQMLLELASSTRNALAAYQIANNELLRDRRGNPIMFTEDINIQTIFARGAGFQLSEVTEMYKSFNQQSEVNKRVDLLADQIMDVFYRRHVAGSTDEVQARRLEIMVGSMMAAENPGVQQKVRDQIKRRLNQSDVRMDRANRNFMERVIEETYTKMDVLSKEYHRITGEE